MEYKGRKKRKNLSVPSTGFKDLKKEMQKQQNKQMFLGKFKNKVMSHENIESPYVLNPIMEKPSKPSKPSFKH